MWQTKEARIELGAPRLKSIEVSARKIEDAKKNIEKRNPGGTSALEYTWGLMSKYNIDPSSLAEEEISFLSKFQDGNLHFFFGTAKDGYVLCVFLNGRKFDRRSLWLGLDWLENYRAVLEE